MPGRKSELIREQEVLLLGGVAENRGQGVSTFTKET